METKFEETTLVNSDSKPLFPTFQVAGDHPFWFEGLLSSLLISGQDTQGQATLLETIQKKGLEPGVSLKGFFDTLIIW